MLPKSANYNTIWNGKHLAETKIVVGADTYTQTDILSCRRTQDLFAGDYDLGNTVVNQFEFSLMGADETDIPRMSRVEVWTRLWNNLKTDSTDWLPMGVYYTAKPEYDTETHIIKVQGYDEMFRTGVVPFEGGASVTAWVDPTLRQVANHILLGTNVTGVIESNFAGIGLELEDDTQILDTITMPSIPYNYTIREILRDIAIACCGNWTVVFQDDNGVQKSVLRLVKNANWTSALVDLGRNVTSFEKGDDIPEATDIYVYYGYDSNGASVYGHAEATPNDGREFEIEVKTITDGTQANLIAAEILANLGTYYKPYSAQGAELDPALELGDTITVNSVSSVLGSISCNFNQGMWAEISAPGIEPVDEFDFLSGSVRAADRIERSAEINSAKISVNTDAITAEVQRATSAESDINEAWRTEVNQTADEIRATVISVQTDINNHAAEQQQYIRYSADGLELGESGTNAKAILTNEALKFYDPSDDVKAYIGLDELYNPDSNPIEQGGLNASTGADYSANDRVRTKGYIAVSPSTQYIVTCNIPNLTTRQYGSSKNFISGSGANTSPYTFTTSANTYFIRVSFWNTTGNIVPTDVTELSITATNGDYKFFVINGHIVRQLELGDHWLLVASGSDNDNRLTFKWRA